MKNIFVNSVLLGLMLILLLQSTKNKSWTKLKNTFLCMCLPVLCVFVFMTVRLFFKYGYDYDLIGNFRLIMSVLCLLMLISAFIASMILSSVNGVDVFLLCLWASFSVMIAPLFVVTPIGGRCFLETYVILILIVCRLADRISVKEWSKREKTILSFGAVVFMVTMIAGHLYIYGSNCVADLRRTKYIKEAVSTGEMNITMKRLPFEYYMWYGSPGTEERVKEYTRFNGIPEDTTLIVE